MISPCINVVLCMPGIALRAPAKMEEGFCAGYFRTIAEIAGWATATDDDKRLILAAAAQRRTRLGAAQP
ncbi:MAG: DUF1289 domain-containing protein [Sulfuritalea sp.]|nr:DUF1289 domain-containing protein [Sulfuritalea sp.]